MSTKKSALKQYLKYILQKTLLPIWYDSCRNKPIEEKLVLFAADGGTGEARVQVRGVVLRFLGGGLWRNAQIYARFHEAVRRGARAGDLQLFRASARLPKALRNAGGAALAFLRRAEKIRLLYAGRHPTELQGQRFAQHRPRYRKLACVCAGF